MHEHLELAALTRPHLQLRLGQWLEFVDKSGKRWCQVDALMLDREKKVGIIYEVKYQHTSDAWWQLRHLYLPVLEAAAPEIRWGLMEIVHWYDPQVPFPERPVLTPELTSVPKANCVAVHILNPKRRSQLPG